MELQIQLTIPQASALIHAIRVCLHLADKSPNSAAAHDIDLSKVKTMNDALERIDAAIPHFSPDKTNEPCNTPQTTSSQPSTAS